MPPEHSGHTTKIADLLQVMQNGDRAEARRLLIEHAEARLHLLARRMLRRFPKVRRWEETDDVFVEAVTRLHRCLEEVQPESPRHFYNLAATHCRRVLIEMARRHFGSKGLGTNQETDGEQVHQGKAEDNGTAPSSVLEWTDFHEAVEKLPEEEREVFSLLWYEELSQAEAAEVLGISVRTIKRRWQSARCILGNNLDG